MKPILFCLIFLSAALTSQAQDRWLYWKYKDYDGGMNFTVPRLAISTGSLFIKEKSDRKMLRRVHKVRTLIFEDGSPMSERDIKKFAKKARRRHLEELITVREGKTHVRILAKERRSTFRKVVVLVSSPEDGFIMVSLKGKLRFSDINKAFQKIKSDGDKPGKNILPNMIKIPTEKA
jgi:hypothetical protein